MSAWRGKGRAIVVDVSPGVNGPVGDVEEEAEDAAEHLGLNEFPAGPARLPAWFQRTMLLDVECQSQCEVED